MVDRSTLAEALATMSKSQAIAMTVNPTHQAIQTVMAAARRVLEPDYEAAARMSMLLSGDDNHNEACWKQHEADSKAIVDAALAADVLEGTK